MKTMLKSFCNAVSVIAFWLAVLFLCFTVLCNSGYLKKTMTPVMDVVDERIPAIEAVYDADGYFDYFVRVDQVVES